MAWVVTAVAVAIELGTVAAIATAVAEVGIAMTVVGKVTKSKELVKIGGILSIAGGVTSLAASAGAFGTAAASGASDIGAAAIGDDAAGFAAGAFDNGLASAATDSVVGEGLSATTNAAANSNFGIDGLRGAVGDADFAGGFGGADSAVPGFAAPAPVAGQTAAAQVASTFGAAEQAAVKGASTDYGAFAPEVVAPNAGTALPTVPSASQQATAPNSGAEAKGWFSKQSPQVQSQILQGGLQAVGGLFNGWSAEQKLALEREIQDQKTQQYNTSMANASAVPSIKFQPVKGLVGSVLGK